MPSTKQERALRRTVAQLSHCSMDDIEWIWSTLDTEQRQRLRPLLAEARPDWPVEPPAHASASAGGTSPNSNAMPVRSLAEFIRRLPAEWAGNVLACLDDQQRQLVAQHLPPNMAHAHHTEHRMTARAQRTLRDAIFESANRIVEPPASKQSAWRRLFQRKVRR